MNNTLSLDEIKSRVSVCFTGHGHEAKITLKVDFKDVIWEHHMVKLSIDDFRDFISSHDFKDEGAVEFIHSPRP
jgi:hypothetical protein